MANAQTILHHLRNIAAAAGYKLGSDSITELQDALESIDDQINELQQEVRALRKQVPDNPLVVAQIMNSSIETLVGEEVLDDARVWLKSWRDELGQHGEDFQALYMYAFYLMQVVDRILPTLTAAERLELLDSALRIAQLADPGFDPDWTEIDGEPKSR